jgi:hypothetical protein
MNCAFLPSVTPGMVAPTSLGTICRYQVHETGDMRPEQLLLTVQVHTLPLDRPAMTLSVRMGAAAVGSPLMLHQGGAAAPLSPALPH